MPSIKVLLKKEKIDSKGQAPIYLRIIKDRKPRFISLGYKVKPQNWDEEKQRVKPRFQNAKWLNAFIAKEVAKAEKASAELETVNELVTTNEIKKKVTGKSNVSFIDYFQKYLDNLDPKKNYETHKSRKVILNKLKEYLNGKDLLFHELTTEFLDEYSKYLKTKFNNDVNTIHNNLKSFRKLCYDAEREELIEYKHNPFHKYKLKTKKSTKEHLYEDELKKMEDLKLTKDTTIYHHRNIYVFACYAGGLRISDIATLKWRDYNGTHITLLATEKTDEPVTIFLPKKAQEIIKYYQNKSNDKDDYVFPLLKENKEYGEIELKKAISSITAYANKNLKIMAKRVKIKKHLSFHTSRHTWATRALRKGMPLPYVSKLMGHATTKTTEIYTKIVNKELDEAMKVFDE